MNNERYVFELKILTERQLYRAVGEKLGVTICRSQPPRQEDLAEWGAFVLQPNNPPPGDIVVPTQTAEEREDGLWHRVYETRAFSVDELSNYQAQATQRINAHYEQLVSETAKAWYPWFERETWPQQESEARAWLGDSTAATQSIDKLLADPVDQEAKRTLCERICNKADAYRNLALTRTRELQAHRAAIWASVTKAEVDAVLQAALV